MEWNEAGSSEPVGAERDNELRFPPRGIGKGNLYRGLKLVYPCSRVSLLRIISFCITIHLYGHPRSAQKIPGACCVYVRYAGALTKDTRSVSHRPFTRHAKLNIGVSNFLPPCQNISLFFERILLLRLKQLRSCVRIAAEWTVPSSSPSLQI